MIARLLIVLSLLLPAVAHAITPEDCTPLARDDVYRGDYYLLSPGNQDGVKKPKTLEFQSGLWAYWEAMRGSKEEAAPPRLHDGIIGKDTKAKAQEVCAAPELNGKHDRLALTFAIGLEYGEIHRLLDAKVPVYAPPLADLKMIGQVIPDMLRLAGTPALSAAVLGGAPASGQPDVCNDLRAALARLSDEAAALAGAAGLGLDPAGACALIGGGVTADNVAQTLAEFGALEGLVPGGVAILGSPEFRDWVETDPGRRRLLLGPPAIVHAMVVAFQTEAQSTVPEAFDTSQIKCEALEPESNFGLTYFVLTVPKSETSGPPIATSLAPILEAKYASPQDLAEDIGKTLGAASGSCARRSIDQLIDQASDQLRVFTLSPDKLHDVRTNPAQADKKAPIEALAKAETTTKEAMETAVAAALDVAAKERIGTDIAKAADLAVASAEEVPMSNDAPVPWEQPQGPPAGPKTAFALTEQSIRLIAKQLDDPEIGDALSRSNYAEVANPEGIRLLAFDSLEELRVKRISDEQAEAKLFAADAVSSRWRLTQQLIEALATLPDLSASEAVNFDADETKKDLAALEGFTAPNRQLFEAALIAPTQLPSLASSLSQAQRTALVAASRRNVDAQSAELRQNPLATACGCAESRQENALVYAFHPFWEWPIKGDAETAPPTVDFAYIDRIAFDGIVARYQTTEEPGRPLGFSLKNDQHWLSGGQRFAATAHRFEAKADVSIRVLGWNDWPADKVKEFAEIIADTVNKTYGITGFRAATDHSTVADGVTLLLDEVEAENMLNFKDFLIALRNRLHEEQEITIGLSFDMNNAGQVFSNFGNLLSATATDGKARVDRVLVFLERPTNKTKKDLRAAIENMPEFHGSNRRDLFRKIVPIISPTAESALGRRDVGDQAKGDGAFGQFRDDLVYFRDNFGGIGFWPAAYENGPDAAYLTGLKEQIRHNFNANTYTKLGFGKNNTLDAGLTMACRYVCPNRNQLYATTLLIGIALGLLLLHSIWSGLPDWIYDNLPYGLVAMLLIYAAIGLCSPSERIPAAILFVATGMAWRVFALTSEKERPLP